jgi:phosphoribosylaminoimidazolecarboxamide formyltransferase/IMP cyclohydrolase
VVPVKRALISVSDKTGIVDFCRALQKLDVEIISTGGTATVLQDAGIDVADVSEITGFPEMMDGRVKTLHPLIHGGILALRNNPRHVREAEQHRIPYIDLLAVNLYPFEKTINRENVELSEAIEHIDIGGPTLIRAGAKNYEYVTVITDPADYTPIVEELAKSGGISLKTRETLAVKAFRHTANYDAIIDVYLSKALLGEDVLRLQFTEGKSLRYGENWHQQALFYKENIQGPTLSKARQLHGKQMSYNNYVDADNAMQTIKELEQITNKPAAVVVKHNNPCGLATGNTQLEALEAAWKGDPISAFGSILCFNKPVNLETASFLKGKFVELILAPEFEPEALEFLTNKSRDLRLLELPELTEHLSTEHTYHYIIGGMLKQTLNKGLYEKWEVVTQHPFPEEKRKLAEFTIAACKRTKSNAVVLGYEYKPECYMVLAIGAGQPNRVDSIRKLAATKAQENLKMAYDAEKPQASFEEYCTKIFQECVLASDAFFPFPDSITHAAASHIRYIVSPGGSIRDSEVIAEANKLGVALVFTGMRHFNH